MLKEVLFTHNDLDGYGCGIVYNLAHQHMERGVEYEVCYCTNTNVNDVVKSMYQDMDSDLTKITFADICCSEEVLRELNDAGFEINVFDHHPTNAYAKDVIGDNAVIIPADETGKMQCGTSLLFDHYMEMVKDDPFDKHALDVSNTNVMLLSKFVDTVRSYDTWEWKSTNNMDAKYLNTLLYMMDSDAFVDKYIAKVCKEFNPLRYGFTSFTKNELFDENDMTFILSKIHSEQKIIDEFTPDKVVPINVRGYNCALILGHVAANIGDLGYQFLNKYPEFDMICQFIINSNGLLFSFRCTRDDIDLGKEISAPIGGGGHPKAAGAPIDESIKNQIVSILEKYLNK